MNRKSYPSFSSPLTILGVAFLAACSAEGRPADEPDPLVEVGEQNGQVTKGNPGAVNGASDYCDDPANPCGPGEGDCDASSQCQTGLVCGGNLGPRFGLPADLDVCVAPHCINGIQDANETGIDIGDGCGSAVCPSDSLNGGDAFCTETCPCAEGQGDCDNNKECLAGLICGTNLGPRFGMPGSHDVCVAPHCLDKKQDGDETGVDCGGSCGVCLVGGAAASAGSCAGKLASGVCSSCLEANCCAEITACLAGPSCTDCINDPSSPGCSGDGSWLALSQCSGASCAAPCAD